VAEIFENREAVFAKGGDIAADAGVTTGARQGAKATGDLQPYFHHAEGPFGFVVGMRSGLHPKRTNQNAISRSSILFTLGTASVLN
jgi:hypothetical protein